MLIFALFILVIAAVSAYLARRFGPHPEGSANAVDRCATRVDHELRALLGVRGDR